MELLVEKGKQQAMGEILYIELVCESLKRCGVQFSMRDLDDIYKVRLIRLNSSGR